MRYLMGKQTGAGPWLTLVAAGGCQVEGDLGAAADCRQAEASSIIKPPSAGTASVGAAVSTGSMKCSNWSSFRRTHAISTIAQTVGSK